MTGWEPFVGPFVTAGGLGIGGILWLVWRAYDRADVAKTLAEEAVSVGRREAAEAARSCGRDIAALELRIAKEFTTVAYTQDVERRMLATLDRIEKKVDRLHGGSHGVGMAD